MATRCAWINFGMLCFAVSLPCIAVVPAATRDNQDFRKEVIAFVRAAVTTPTDTKAFLQPLQRLDRKWDNAYQRSDWQVQITAYLAGRVCSTSAASGRYLPETLLAASRQLWRPTCMAKALANARLQVTFSYYPSRVYSFIESDHEGLELTGSRVAVRLVTTQRLVTQILRSKAYLQRVMHPSQYGFYKFYYADKDKAQTTLRTIYSSSSLYTLLKLNAWRPDPAIASVVEPIASFILSNQSHKSPVSGAFDYSVNAKTGKHADKYVVGTTSKTIFTLLALHQTYPSHPIYLKAAKAGGQWLVSMVKPDGRVMSSVTCKDAHCTMLSSQSLLYSGQVLSALSRLYQETKQVTYDKAATRIAQHFLKRMETEGLILGDDYRPANSISSSWVLLSLLDYARAHPQGVSISRLQALADTLIARQIRDPADIFSDGRYRDAMTASGNGWLNEVMGEMHRFCVEKHLSHCQRYQDAMVHTSRWLLQNAYTPENTYNVQNPAHAIGGFITNFNTHSVRTDAVCHGVNSLLRLLTMVPPDAKLLTIPERPLDEVLPLLRAGDAR